MKQRFGPHLVVRVTMEDSGTGELHTTVVGESGSRQSQCSIDFWHSFSNCGSFDIGDSPLVTLEATTTHGTLVTWSGPCSGHEPKCTFRADGEGPDVTVGATFTGRSPTLDVEVAGAGSVHSVDLARSIDCPTDCRHTYAQHTSVTLVATPNEGWVFRGWSAPVESQCGAEVTCTIRLDDDKPSLAILGGARYGATARFIRAGGEPLTISLVSEQGGGGQIVSSDGTLRCASTCETRLPWGESLDLRPMPAPGSVFAGWAGDCQQTVYSMLRDACDVKMVDIRSVSARFVGDQPIASVAVVGPGVVTANDPHVNSISCPARCESPFLAGTTMRFWALPVAGLYGSRFIGWSGACTGTDPACDVTMDGPQWIVANFRPSSFVVGARLDGNGSGSVTLDGGSSSQRCESVGCSFPYPDGTTVTLTPAPEPGSIFAGWEGACSGTGACTVTADEDRLAVASFMRAEQQLTVSPEPGRRGAGTVVSSPAGVDCAECTATFDFDATVTLHAEAAPGSVFDSWQGDCAGEGPTCVLTMDRERWVRPLFTFLPRPLDVMVGGSGTGAVTSDPAGIWCPGFCSSELGHGTGVTLRAHPAADSVFAGWSGACTGTDPVCLVTMDAATSVVATFEAMRSASMSMTGIMVDGHLIRGGAIAAGDVLCRDWCHSPAVPRGTTQLFTAVPDPGWEVAHWGRACTHAGAASTCTVSIGDSTDVVVTFRPVVRVLTLAVANEEDSRGSLWPSSYPGALVGSVPCDAYSCVEVRLDATVTITPYAHTGSVFTGWSGACVGLAPTCTVTMSEARAVAASFAPAATTGILVEGRQGGAIRVADESCRTSCTSPAARRGSNLTFTAVPDPGWEVSEWTRACTPALAEPSCDIVVTEGAMVGAWFRPSVHTLFVEITGAGSVTSDYDYIDCGSTCAAVVYELTPVTFTAMPRPTWAFVGWSGACTGTQLTCTTTITEAETVFALFEPERRLLELTVSGDGDGRVTGSASCASSCDVDLPYGSEVVLVARADDGSRFAGWSGCERQTSSRCTFTMSFDREVTARFERIPRFDLTVTRAGAGTGSITSEPSTILCGDLCSASFRDGTIVSLTASPSGTDVFAGWSGDCSGTATTCTITMGADRQVTATFARPPVTLAVTQNGLGTGTVTSDIGGLSCGSTCEIDVAEGTALTLTAAPDDDSEVLGWDGCESNPTSTTCAVTADGDTTVTVTFDPIDPVLTVDSLAGTVTSDVGDIDCGDTCAEAYAPGTTVTLTAVAPAGIATTSWTGCDSPSTTDTCVVTITADTTVELRYTIPFTIDVVGSGLFGRADTDIGTLPFCTSTCAPLVTFGRTVTLTAVPNGGAVPAWTGCDDAVDSTCTVTVDELETVELDWIPS